MQRSERDREFADFTAAHRTALVSMARLLTAGDEPWAEDLAQATLTKLYVAWPRVRRAGNPVGYARTALTRVFFDETRRAHRRREVAVEHGSLVTVPAADDATGADLRHDVLAALADLAPRQRAVVVLRHWLDLDTAETARLLGCSDGTVKSQNAKALAHLRDVLGDTLSPVPEEKP